MKLSPVMSKSIRAACAGRAYPYYVATDDPVTVELIAEELDAEVITTWQELTGEAIGTVFVYRVDMQREPRDLWACADFARTQGLEVVSLRSMI